MAQRFRPHSGSGTLAEPKPQVEVEPMGIKEYRRMLYDATANGWSVEKAGQLIRQIQQETPDMYTSAFEPGTAEFERYYDLRRAGKSRREAFGLVLKENDIDNPDDALTAREIQEGREAVVLPGGRQSFHNSSESEKPSKGTPKGEDRPSTVATNYPTRRESMQSDIDAAMRRDKAAEAAKKASTEAKASSVKERPVTKSSDDSSKKDDKSSVKG